MPNQSPHFQRVAEQYNKLTGRGPYATLAPHNRGGRKSEYVNAVFDAAILPRLHEGDCRSVLDFGSGTGVFSRTLAGLGFRVSGVDVSEQMVHTAGRLCDGVPKDRKSGV